MLNSSGRRFFTNDIIACFSPKYKSAPPSPAERCVQLQLQFILRPVQSVQLFSKGSTGLKA